MKTLKLWSAQRKFFKESITRGDMVTIEFVENIHKSCGMNYRDNRCFQLEEFKKISFGMDFRLTFVRDERGWKFDGYRLGK